MARKVKVDMSNVESYLRASEGQHMVKIYNAEASTSQSGNDMITVVFEVVKGADKTARVYENYPLVDKALWKLKGLLQAIGMKADGKIVLDLDKLIGRILLIDVNHEEYNGQVRARVEQTLKYDGGSEAEEEDDWTDDEVEDEDLEDDDFEDEEEDDFEDEEEVDIPKDLTSLTVKELKTLAGDLGVDLTGIKKKADLIKAIKDNQNGTDDFEDEEEDDFEDEEVEEETESKEDLTSMSAGDLKKLAKKEGVDTSKVKNKKALIKAIEDARESDEEDDDWEDDWDDEDDEEDWD